MKEFKSHILIVGGSLTGLMAAFVLSALNKKIVVVERSSFILKNISPINDMRTTAISEGSKKILQKAGFWEKIKKFAEPIKFINVQDRDINNKINFFNFNEKKPLGYIIKNSLLKEVLIQLLKTKKNIKLIQNQDFKNFKYNESNILAIFKDFVVCADLIIAADGKNSTVRKVANTPIYSKKYKHKAAVINISHLKNHNNIAHEIFFKTGPLAILPMSKNKKNIFLSSVIWSNPSWYSDNLKKINKDTLKELLQEKIYKNIGEIKEVLNVQFFPLSAHVNSKFYENRIVYIGDSAHSIHPIAGQGWNLGIRDIKNLDIALKKNINLGFDLGSEFACKEYQKMSFYDAYSMFQITDKLNSIFINDFFMVNKIRSLGFKLIQKNSMLKKIITDFAMGFK